eukprot:TRINITY_DN1399_c1_g1_i3.p1 TRINITY_DN1399_c1_g1~~TRINITY_DN1399_c1_g1_i3.p1  ORF type:complete len:1823 (-),score=494.16 TRINITY_DN1399_c1_g1_i3:200-5668(-)
MEPQSRVWIPCPEEGWIPAVILESDGDQLTVKDEYFNEESVVSKKEVVILQESSLDVIPDLISISDLHEATLLYNLRERYKKDQIYTYIGPMIVSVNPFKSLPIYNEDMIPVYLEKSREELEPHLFSIAQKAWQSLRQLGQSQSVVISGESGAGKTEATKVVLKFLTFVASKSSSNKSDLASRILATNPVLEAFGNAKTTRNNNSSRFGKFIKIAFESDSGKILGARIDNYLLEQTRVVGQATNERNYHIFYQLVNGSNDEEKRKYCLLSSPSEYHYLSKQNLKVNGINDASDFLELKSAMTTLGISTEEQSQFFSILSGILLLGNVEFYGDERADIVNVDILDYLCKLLCVPSDILRSTLTYRRFSSGNRASSVKIPLSHEQAIENRDALSKAIYSRMFDYLVSQLNKHLILGSSFPENSKFIGVLDIYGFEKFKFNSLEQFCINYANEKLHSQFNQHMFKAEQEEYTKEGVPWQQISFVDNKATIDLIEKPVSGLLGMLDEECRMPKGSDKTYLEKIKKSKAGCKELRFDPKYPEEFFILHYAEPVPYNINGLLNKNRDTITADLLGLMAESQSQLLKNLFNESPPGEESDEGRGSRQRMTRTTSTKSTSSSSSSKVTVTKKFSQSLQELVDTLASSHRHYVRCIKPNDTASPDDFIGNKVLSQLRSNGVLETVKLRKAGYSNRIPHDTFCERYKILGIQSKSKDDIRDCLENNLSSANDWVVGITKVFLRDSGLEELEERRAEKLKASVVCLQGYIRCFYARLKFLKLRLLWKQRMAAATIIQKNIRAHTARLMYEKLREIERKKKESGAIVLQKYIKGSVARKKFKFMMDMKDEKLRYEYSSTVIQSSIRMFNARRKLDDLVIKKKEEMRRIKEEEDRQRRIKEEQERIKREKEEEDRRQEQLRIQREEEEKEREEEKKKKLEEEKAKKQQQAPQKLKLNLSGSNQTSNRSNSQSINRSNSRMRGDDSNTRTTSQSVSRTNSRMRGGDSSSSYTSSRRNVDTGSTRRNTNDINNVSVRQRGGVNNPNNGRPSVSSNKRTSQGRMSPTQRTASSYSPRRSRFSSPSSSPSPSPQHTPRSHSAVHVPSSSPSPSRSSSMTTIDSSNEEISSAVIKISTKYQLGLPRDKIELYVEMLKENLVYKLYDVRDLDMNCWTILANNGFPLRLRQLLIKESGSTVDSSIVDVIGGGLTSIIKTVSSRTSSVTSSTPSANSGTGVSDGWSILSGISKAILGESINTGSSNTNGNYVPNPTIEKETLSDIELRDFELLYNVTRQTYLACHFVLPHQAAVELAALSCHIVLGDYDPTYHSVNDIRNNVNEIFPSNFDVNPIIQMEVLDRYKELQHVSLDFSRKEFYKLYWSIPDNDGFIRFEVIDITGGSSGSEHDDLQSSEDRDNYYWILALSNNCIDRLVYDSDKSRWKIQSEWDYSMLTKWDFDEDSGTFSITTIVDNAPINFQFKDQSYDGSTLTCLITHFYDRNNASDLDSDISALDYERDNTSSSSINSSEIDIEIQVFGTSEFTPFRFKKSSTVREICKSVSSHFQLESDNRYGLRPLKSKRNEYLDPNLTLPQIGIRNGQFVLCMRLFYPYTNLTTKSTMNIKHMFFECVDGILSESWSAKRDQVTKLASFHLQYLQGNYNPKIHTKSFFNPSILSRFVPQMWLKDTKMVDSIIMEYKTKSGMDKNVAASKYIELSTGLASYGDTNFDFNASEGNQYIPEILQLSPSRLSRLDCESGRSFESYSLDHVVDISLVDEYSLSIEFKQNRKSFTVEYSSESPKSISSFYSLFQDYKMSNSSGTATATTTSGRGEKQEDENCSIM